MEETDLLLLYFVSNTIDAQKRSVLQLMLKVVQYSNKFYACILLYCIVSYCILILTVKQGNTVCNDAKQYK